MITAYQAIDIQQSHLLWGGATTHCDECNDLFPTSWRYPVGYARPSDPTEWCAVMWLCPRCGIDANLKSIEQLDTEIDANGTVYGQPFLFLTA